MRIFRAASRLVLLAYLAAACATWTPPAPPGNADSSPNGRVAIVTLVDGTTHHVSAARFSSDSVVGFVAGQPFARPLSEVGWVSVRHIDPQRTSLVVVAAIGLVALVITTVASAHRPLIVC